MIGKRSRKREEETKGGVKKLEERKGGCVSRNKKGRGKDRNRKSEKL